nr:5540_t:CDS:2 [Entrophospora candida]
MDGRKLQISLKESKNKSPDLQVSLNIGQNQNEIIDDNEFDWNIDQNEIIKIEDDGGNDNGESIDNSNQ